MSYTQEYIQDKLTKKLNASHVEVTDDSDGCGSKFTVIIVSDEFEGKTLLQQHRLVHSILEEELKIIHAFSVKTFTSEQWKKQQI
ncbi:PREDICTED: protein BOLA2-like isoform X2 [Polistes dominula]|uniref:Protein BOLA2-like isoform X2 n=1 Tax=Polistes dominula TaxID=743375 RepID=A0ABM1I949_POLDO|nr:PREDICTED: protein BOLA2-like isoform X2 [Polistes dominula]